MSKTSQIRYEFIANTDLEDFEAAVYSVLQNIPEGCQVDVQYRPVAAGASVLYTVAIGWAP